ncbi:unnamed protein product [Arabis nemorensis]|uniref:Uncharacterized protein n=1 Tax=Arabis nemorensis TaxID=586526 RepID=A0A565BH38_9BRAS|nr:unnamed protein product [Arabis nemorensis]
MDRVSLKSYFSGTGASDILYLIHEFTVNEPPPANIMVISDPDACLSDLTPSGYNCILQPSLESLLGADSGVLEDDKCGEMRDCICWVCSESSGLVFQSFEDFTTHLASRRHQRMVIK